MSELNVETKLRMMAKGHAVSGDVCRADYCAKLAIQLDGEKSKMTDEIAELRGVLTQVLDGLEDAEATLEQYPFNRSLVSEIDLIKESLNK